MADTGSFYVGDFEKQYEELFAEALEEGEISAEERHRLDLAAAALGLDPERARRLENALLHVYESHAAITLAEKADPSVLADLAPQTERPMSGFFEGDDDRPTPVTGMSPIPDENALLHERFAAARRVGQIDVSSARRPSSCGETSPRRKRRGSSRRTVHSSRPSPCAPSRASRGTASSTPRKIAAPATSSR